ncbi:flagellar hook-basal body complex protein FliE [Thermatribacter velox]|uniref:Flagellar hook-basal body complex protein FliE n=1 Tax=Thermatribacter velox TaxID=3039681 RepID=A0ABZ2YAA5_9BACT
MVVGKVSGALQGIESREVASLKKSDKSEKSFSELVGGFLEGVNALQKEADQAIQDVVLGKEENLHQAMIALEKANLALELTVQVRNKVVEAYQEIMRMQV